MFFMSWLIYFSLLLCGPGTRVSLHSHFSDKETEAGMGEDACPRFRVCWGAEGKGSPKSIPAHHLQHPLCCLTTPSPSAHELLVSRVCPRP